jgi:NAD(P)-dependent dehydrogenase (short-subunit alcohol dehydrogenase family)
MKLNGQVVVISGGASGIGAKTATYLASKGLKIAILDRNFSEVQKIAGEIQGLAIECDVTQSAHVEQAFQKIEQQLGQVRVCINCAGILAPKTILSKDHVPMPLEDFAQVIQVNLIGTFNVMRVAAARMADSQPVEGQDQERGVIINTASIAAFEGQIGQAAYSASKGGVVGLTLPAARELARYGIRVMTIAPGPIATPMLQGLTDPLRENLTSSIPFPKRLGDPVEFAQLVEHIIENTFLNGAVIRLDGGSRLPPK